MCTAVVDRLRRWLRCVQSSGPLTFSRVVIAENEFEILQHSSAATTFARGRSRRRRRRPCPCNGLLLLRVEFPLIGDGSLQFAQ